MGNGGLRFDRLFIFFIPYVTDALEEHQRQDVTLLVRAIHGAVARGFPEV
jgi:hypothetical protein